MLNELRKISAYLWVGVLVGKVCSDLRGRRFDSKLCSWERAILIIHSIYVHENQGLRRVKLHWSNFFWLEIPCNKFLVNSKLSTDSKMVWIYWQWCLESSGQGLENVIRIHLVLMSSTLVVQKNCYYPC